MLRSFYCSWFPYDLSNGIQYELIMSVFSSLCPSISLLIQLFYYTPPLSLHKYIFYFLIHGFSFKTHNTNVQAFHRARHFMCTWIHVTLLCVLIFISQARRHSLYLKQSQTIQKSQALNMLQHLSSQHKFVLSFIKIYQLLLTFLFVG